MARQEPDLTHAQMLAEAYNRLGVSEAEFARRLAEHTGKTATGWRSKLGRWRRGKNKMRADSSREVAEFLGEPVEKWLASPTQAQDAGEAIAALEARADATDEAIAELRSLVTALRDLVTQLPDERGAAGESPDAPDAQAGQPG